MTPKDLAIDLLAKGIPTSQVAAAVGVDDSYISQLKADPEVQALILSKQTAVSLADSKFDETLERAEMLALEKIEKNLQFATLGQAMAAFRTLNGARRRQDSQLTPDAGVSVTVNLTLPSTALPQYVTNTKNEIIEVEGRTMLSATPKTLDAILAARATDGNGLALPGLTSLEKAAQALEAIKLPARQAPRKVPSQLSADML